MKKVILGTVGILGIFGIVALCFKGHKSGEDRKYSEVNLSDISDFEPSDMS